MRRANPKMSYSANKSGQQIEGLIAALQREESVELGMMRLSTGVENTQNTAALAPNPSFLSIL